MPLTFGAGFEGDRIQVNYAYNDHEFMLRAHQFGVSILHGGRARSGLRILDQPTASTPRHPLMILQMIDLTHHWIWVILDIIK